jgi:hypothetical protein
VLQPQSGDKSAFKLASMAAGEHTVPAAEAALHITLNRKVLNKIN